MPSLPTDLRHSLRILRRAPGTTILAVLALGLGIGLTAAQFSLIDSLLLTPLPFEEGSRLLHLERKRAAEGRYSIEVTQHDFIDWRAQQTSFEDLAAFDSDTVNLAGDGRPERYQGAFITSNFLPLLRVEPRLGRGFTDADALPGATPVMLISDELWQLRFGGDPAILGRSILANGVPTTVVGVMPPAFSFPVMEEVWVPLTLEVDQLERGAGTTLEVFGRLRDEVSPEQAAAEMELIAARLAEAYPASNEGLGAVVKPYKEEFIGRSAAAMLWTMFGAVTLVLLIACANVANLLLVRAAARSKELAIKSALGASRSRAILQLLLDGLWLSLLGAGLGLLVARGCLVWFNGMIADVNPPFWFRTGLSPNVLLCVLAATLGSGFLAALLPALQATRGSLVQVLADASRGSSSLRLGRLARGLVVAELAMSCALLIAAGLSIHSVVRLAKVPLSFDPAPLTTARISLGDGRYGEPAARLDFLRRYEAALASQPELSRLTFTTSVPTDSANRAGVEVEGNEVAANEQLPAVNFFVVSPSFFEVFNVGLVEGRSLAASDHQETLPVALVTRSFVERFFPGQSPLGHRIRLDLTNQDSWRTIVGVIPDQPVSLGRDVNPAAAVLPLAQRPVQSLVIAFTGPAPVEEQVEALRTTLADLDGEEPLFFVRPMAEVIERNSFEFRVMGIMFSAFAVAALLLASVGQYGVMAFAVGQRTQEIGVRMAFGARQGQVLSMVLRQGLKQILIGLGAGLVLGAGLARLLASSLYDVRASDPGTYAGTVLLLAVVGLAACALPARRAAALDPVKALQHE